MGILSRHLEVPRILEPSEHMLCLHHVFHNLEEESNLLRLEWTLSFQSTESYILTLKSRQPHKDREGWGRTTLPDPSAGEMEMQGLYFPRGHFPMRS